MHLTVAARDNITLRCEGECMAFLSVTADLLNAKMEEKRDLMANCLSDLLIFGRCEMELE